MRNELSSSSSSPPENQLKGILLPDIDAWNAEILRKKF